MRLLHLASSLKRGFAEALEALKGLYLLEQHAG
jgi:hypothetical protein